jgi:hypothetical protein
MLLLKKESSRRHAKRTGGLFLYGREETIQSRANPMSQANVFLVSSYPLLP